MEPTKEGFSTTARKLASNPLGIIALFIVLVYAMAALVLGAAGNNLNANQRWSLVLFLVIFPVIVLAVFSWLVSKHHTKLYSPRDFPNEEGFFRVLTPAEQRERLQEEAEEVAEVPPKLPDARIPTEAARPIWPPSLDGVTSRVFLIEALVFRQLELEFGQSIQRQVSIGRDLGFDGLIPSKEGLTVFEIKYLHTPRTDTIRRAIGSMKQASNRMPHVHRFVLVVVTEGFSDERVAELTARAKDLIAEAGIPIDLRFYDVEELGRKFGVAVRAQPAPPADG
jgi:hypothetical protein